MGNNGEIKKPTIWVQSTLDPGQAIETEISGLTDEMLVKAVQQTVRQLNIIKAQAETIMSDMFNLKMEAVKRGLYEEELNEQENNIASDGT